MNPVERYYRFRKGLSTPIVWGTIQIDELLGLRRSKRQKDRDTLDLFVNYNVCSHPYGVGGGGAGSKTVYTSELILLGLLAASLTVNDIYVSPAVPAVPVTRTRVPPFNS